jgi:hypothetical protein
VQNAEFKDSAGNKIRFSAWEHPDLKPLEGKEVILHSSKMGNGKFGGVSVKHSSYVTKKPCVIGGKAYKQDETVLSIELSVSKAGQFQLVEVYQQQNPKAVVSSDQAAAPVTEYSSGNPVAIAGATGLRPIHGATVGAAINNVCDNLTARGEELDPKKIYVVASGLVKLALHMESGHLYTPKTPEQEKQERVDADHEKLANVSKEPVDEVPF